MADTAKDAPSEVRRNYEAFVRKLPELLPRVAENSL